MLREPASKKRSSLCVTLIDRVDEIVVIVDGSFRNGWYGFTDESSMDCAPSELEREVVGCGDDLAPQLGRVARKHIGL